MTKFFSTRKTIFLFAVSLWLLILTSCQPANIPVVSSPQENPPAIAQESTCPETSLPWDISYLSNDSQTVINRIDALLENTGLARQGSTILSLSKQYGINPAFALSMFRKEASFAALSTRAYSNNNPGNIIATGNCKGLSANQSCNGAYGEISTDGRFGKYQNMADGIKAYYVLLSSEYKPGTKRDCNDLDCIVSAYAPPSENDTTKYIQQISGWTKQYQCQLAGVTEPSILESAPTLSNVSATIVAVTPLPNKKQVSCSDLNLTAEECANNGTHIYSYVSTVTEGNCSYNKTGDKVVTGSRTITITFSKDRTVTMETELIVVAKKSGLNTYIYTYATQDDFSGTLTFNSSGFTDIERIPGCSFSDVLTIVGRP